MRDGRVTEGSSSTVFIVTRRQLVHAAQRHSILPGTSRDAVSNSRQVGCRSRSARSAVDDCAGDEVWIASAGRGVLPVTRIDGKAIGNGSPGAPWLSMYARLQQHLDAIAARPALVDA